MSKKFKKQVSLILAVITLLSTLAVFANAACTYRANAFNIPTTSQYAKVYPLSASGTTISYTSKSLSTRGTTNGAS